MSIFLLFSRRRKASPPETAADRVYRYALTQVLGRRAKYGTHPQQAAPWDRPENAERRVSLRRRVA